MAEISRRVRLGWIVRTLLLLLLGAALAYVVASVVLELATHAWR